MGFLDALFKTRCRDCGEYKSRGRERIRERARALVGLPDE